MKKTLKSMLGCLSLFLISMPASLYAQDVGEYFNLNDVLDESSDFNYAVKNILPLFGDRESIVLVAYFYGSQTIHYETVGIVLKNPRIVVDGSQIGDDEFLVKCFSYSNTEGFEASISKPDTEHFLRLARGVMARATRIAQTEKFSRLPLPEGRATCLIFTKTIEHAEYWMGGKLIQPTSGTKSAELYDVLYQLYEDCSMPSDASESQKD